MHIPVISSFMPALDQCWYIFVFDAVVVFKSVPFLVMLLCGVLDMVGSSSQLG